MTIWFASVNPALLLWTDRFSIYVLVSSGRRHLGSRCWTASLACSANMSLGHTHVMVAASVAYPSSFTLSTKVHTSTSDGQADLQGDAAVHHYSVPDVDPSGT